MPPPVSQLFFQNEGISNQRLHELPSPELLKFPAQRRGSSPVRTFLAGTTPWVRSSSMAKRERKAAHSQQLCQTRFTDKNTWIQKNTSLPLGRLETLGIAENLLLFPSLPRANHGQISPAGCRTANPRTPTSSSRSLQQSLEQCPEGTHS